MGTEDIKNTAQDVTGNIKEGVGSATGDKSLENEGKADQLKAAAKDVGEDIKDTADKAVDAVKDIFK